MSDVQYADNAYDPAGMEDEGEDTQAPGFDLIAATKSANLAFDLDDSTLAAMGAKVCEEFELDLTSRKEAGYEERIEQAVKLASLAKEVKNTPWENASNVKFPLIIQAAIQFNARSYSAVVDGPHIVKGKVLGKDDEQGTKRLRAERVGRHMSYQLLDEMEEWEEDTDALLIRLPIVGTLVRKTYFDPTTGRNWSHVIGPDEFVVNYRAKRDLSVCPRATHVLSFYPHEIMEKRRGGLWLEADLGQPEGNDDQAPHVFLEQHRLWDLDEDGYPEPYIVTVHKETQKVVRVVARWYEDGIKTNARGEIARIVPYECFTKYGFIPSPDGSFYDIGFGTLLGPLSDTINTAINQLMDAATLSNLGGGFINDGISIKSGNLRFKPGEWKKTSSTGGALRENIVPLPAAQPSAVLFQLLGMMIDAAKDLTATQEILTGDAGKSNAPVGTTLALIEQGLKTFTAIVKRIHRSLKRELGVLYKLNGRYLNEEEYFTFQDGEEQTGRADYAVDDIDVVPVSDPTMATDMQKMGRAQFLMGLRGSGLNDMEINKRALEAASIPDVDKLMPQGPPPPDPRLALETRKLDQKDTELQIRDNAEAAKIAETEARIAKLVSETVATAIQSFMVGPQFQLAAIQANAAATAAVTGNTEPTPDGAVQQPDVRGMDQPPPEQGLPPIPGGPEGPIEGPMGVGPGDGPPLPDQGAPPGGVVGPEMV